MNKRSLSAVDSLSVPIQFIEGDLNSASLKISATIDGELVDFQLDTGSNYTSMAYSPLISKYPVSGTIRTTSAAGITIVNDKVKLASFIVGTVNKTNFEVVRYKEGTNLNNRIGMNALSENLLNFDLKNNLLNFKKEFPASVSKQKLNIDKDKQFGMNVKLGNQVIDAIWDTGAELSVVDRDFVAEFPKHFKFIQKIDNGIDATGHPVAFELYEVSDFKIEKTAITGTIMAMNFKMIKEKLGPAIKVILGTNLIRGHNWYFDQVNKTWAIE